MTPGSSATPLRVVVDANVYFIPPVRDFLLNAGWLTGSRLLEIIWSEAILAEVERNWARVTGITRSEERWQRFATRFREVFAAGRGEATIPLRAESGVAPEDRHVVGLALAMRADGVVTLNLRDFPPRELATLGQRVWHPDALCRELHQRNPSAVLAILRHQGTSLRSPRSLAATLDVLSATCPRFVEQVRRGESAP